MGISKKTKSWNIACCFNKMVRNYVYQHYILLEKTNKSDFSKPGEIEVYLNNKVFITDRIKFKPRELPYSENGQFHPLPISKPIGN